MVKKDKKFPRRNFFAIVTGSALIAIYFYHFNNNIEFFPEGYLNQSTLSPTGEYEIKTYNISSQFIDDKTLRAEMVDTHTKKATTIYVNEHKGTALVQWLDHVTVALDEEVINVEKDVYKK